MENLTKSQRDEIMARAEALASIINCPITDAIWRATELLQFKTELLKGEVLFTFLKKNGEIRQARGTLNMGTIPAAKHPKTAKPLNPKVFTYYDLDKDDWRCFKIETFLGVA